MAPRSAALVVVEVTQLEALLAATSPVASDWTLLHRRLAEDYVELRKAGRRATSRKAIEHYDVILRAPAEYTQLDEVLYYEALEHEVSGDLPRARSAYYDLIEKAPTSRFVPFAYYAFGEMFRNEAQADPSKYEPAFQAYTLALGFRDSRIAPEAAYQIATLYTQKGEQEHALAMRERLEKDFPNTPAAKRAAAL
jgi:TolA-binding protein